MIGGIGYDKRSKKYLVYFQWSGRKERIYTHPITREPFYTRAQAQKQHFAMKDIRHLRYNDIMGFKNWLSKEKELSAKTSYNIINVLKKLLRDAWRNEDIAYVPPFPPISYNPPEIKYLTYEQQQKILDATPEKERPIFIFMMEYGLRLCEAQALQKDCVTGDEVIIRRSLVEHKLRETTKTGRKGVRRFKLTPVAREALKNVRLSTSPYIFVKETGYPYSNKDLNRIWHEAEEKTGITCKLYNAVRHSLGCQLLDQGIDIGIVREIYGHTRVEMTSRYACHSSQVIDNALAGRHKKAIEFKKKTEK